jgi:hypothetical protein
MRKFWVIRNGRDEYWQTAKGFVSTRIEDATKYWIRDDAVGARGHVVPNRQVSEVIEVNQ